MAKKAKTPRKESVDKRIIKWLISGSVGASSKSIVDAYYNGSDSQYCTPHDSTDLELCFELVKEIPELRKTVKEMGEWSHFWHAIDQWWDEFEYAYENGYTYGAAREMLQGIQTKMTMIARKEKEDENGC